VVSLSSSASADASVAQVAIVFSPSLCYDLSNEKPHSDLGAWGCDQPDVAVGVHILAQNRLDRQGGGFMRREHRDIFPGSMRELFDILKREEDRRNKAKTPVRLRVLREAAGINCMVGKVPEGKIEPVYYQNRGMVKGREEDGKVWVVIEPGDFLDDELFWQTADDLLIKMGLPPSEWKRGVDNLDRVDCEIIRTVHQIEREGLNATDELVSTRLPLMSPKTGGPYARETINKRRNKLRDKGYEV
jgi:hypothetical protein